MDIKNIILIIISIFSFVVAGYIYGRNRKSHINISFALMFLFAGFWSFTLGLFGVTDEPGSALRYAQIFNIAALFIGASFYYFSSSFPFPSFLVRPKVIVFVFLPAIIVSVLLILFPSFTLGEVHVQSSYGNEVILSSGYYIYAIIFIIYIISSFLLLFKKLQRSEGIIRDQLKYVILGFLFGFIVGIAFNLILPLLGNYQLIWIGPYSTFIVMGHILYLIMRKT